MKPETFEKMIRSVIGDEKAQDFMTLIESGLFVKPILVLTSLYVKDKDNFLIVKDWYFLPRKNKYLTKLSLVMSNSSKAENKASSF